MIWVNINYEVKSMITSRTKEIIAQILEAKDYITIQNIADAIKVSSRTVLRELDTVEAWFHQEDVLFRKKKGRGLLVDANMVEKEALLEKLYSEKSDVIYTPEERQTILRAELLKMSDVTKIYSLTTMLDVTEGTISNDLQQIEPWFQQYDLQLIKRPGLGITLEGDEKAKRKAIVNLIYEHFHVVDLFELMTESRQKQLSISVFKKYINRSILDLLHLDSLVYIKELITRLEKELSYYFADNAYIALFIRFSITLKREPFWKEDSLEATLKKSLEKDPVKLLLEDWINASPNNPFAKLPIDERLYLVMHIKGSKLRETGAEFKMSMIDDFKVIQLAKEFIKSVEIETGIYLSDNDQLLFGLIKHLRPALYRMKMNLDIINPLLSEIHLMYPKLYDSVKKSVAVIEEKEKNKVPEDEIAYLATHIGAAIQKGNRDIVKKYKVIVACMYGIGASHLLISQLEKNFPNIVIIDVVSVFDNIDERMQADGVDLLVTTIEPKGAKTPYVVVGSILQDEDIQKISRALRQTKPKPTKEPMDRVMNIREKYSNLKRYASIILDLINHYACNDSVEIDTYPELIRYVSHQIASNDLEIMILEKAFREREEKGSTILSKKGMILLHCRADITKKICVNIVRLKEPIQHINIQTVVVMVGPLKYDEKILEVLSEITHGIISTEISDAIQHGDRELIQTRLYQLLDKFYQKKVLGD